MEGSRAKPWISAMPPTWFWTSPIMAAPRPASSAKAGPTRPPCQRTKASAAGRGAVATTASSGSMASMRRSTPSPTTAEATKP